MGKTTIQDIADSLDISRVTVWKALSNRPGVSDSMRQKIIDTAVSMQYFSNRVAPITSTEKGLNIVTTFCVITSQSSSSVFWNNVTHEIAKEFAKLHINLLYIYVPDIIDDNYTLPAVLTNGTVKGMIILAVNNLKLLQMLNKLPIAKVFTDTLTCDRAASLNGDLLMVNMQEVCYQVTKHILNHLSTNIGFIGDIHNSIINRDRYNGFLKAMKGNGIDFDPKYSLTEIVEEDVETSVISFLSKLDPQPEFMICTGDHIAYLVSQYYTRFNTHPILVGGYDCSNDYLNFGNSMSIQLPTPMYSKRLTSQLIYRLNNPMAPMEATYLKTNITF